MEKTHKFLVYFFLGVCLGVMWVGVSQAETTNATSDYLVEIGEMYYNKGQKTDAIHEFSKALLINPDNKVAKEYLHKMGLREGLYKPSRTSITIAAESADRLKEYEQKMSQLERDKANLESMFQRLADDRDRLLEENALKDEEIKKLKLSMTPDLAMTSSEDDVVVKNLYEKSDAYKATMATIAAFNKNMTPKIQYLDDGQLTKTEIVLAKTQHHLIAQMDETLSVQDVLLDTQHKYIRALDQMFP